MDDYLDNIGVEEQEVTEPVEVVDDGVEEQEVTEPVDNKTKADAAFANLRRENEALKLANARMDKALGFYFEGKDKDVQAIAHAMGRGTDEIQAALNAETETLQLRERLRELEATRAMEKDLAGIQAIDPSVKSLDELGEDYADLIRRGIDGVRAFKMLKSEQAMDAEKPPKTIGTLHTEPVKKDYYSQQEVDNMSSAELKANHEVIMASMSKW